MKDCWILVAVCASTCVLSNVLGVPLAKEQLSPHIIGGNNHDPSAGNHYSVVILFRKDHAHGEISNICKGAEVQYKNRETKYWNMMRKDDIQAKYFLLRRQQYYLSVLDEKGERSTDLIWSGNEGSSSWAIHPEYNERTKEHNIAVFFHGLERNRDEVLQLPDDEERYDGKQMEIAGWNNGLRGDEIYEDPAIVTMSTSVINSVWCTLVYPTSPLKGSNVCASGWFLKGLSEGDSGAVLTYGDADNTRKLAGIATIVRTGLHYFSLPIEFLSIKTYTKWIKEEAKKRYGP